MSAIERLLKVSAELRAVCEEIAESGYVEPRHHISGLPRELFDQIPAISRVDDFEPGDPIWEKRYKGVVYTCWEAPMVSLGGQL